MMASSGVKYSGGKIVPHSDLRAGTTQEEVIRKGKNDVLRIGAWNVRSLNGSGRLENLKREMDRLKLDVVGISEIRWQDEQDFWSGNYRLISTKANKGIGGVGLLMNKKLGNRVIYEEKCSERLIVARIDTKPKVTVIIQVLYMPTSNAEDEEIEKLYEEVEEKIKYAKGDENLIIMGDWNAVVGKGKEGNIVGEYGLGKRNDRGARLVEFCAKYKLVVANTLFKNHERRIYTWMKPGDTGRYQLDYIMVKQRFRNQVLDCKAFPGADMDSDHNFVVMKCRLKLKKLRKSHKIERWNLQNLKKNEVKKDYANYIESKLKNKNERFSVEEEWKSLKKDILESADKNIGKCKIVGRKPWITENILRLMDERRNNKNRKDEKSQSEYRRLRNQIKRECKLAKEEWINEKCNEIEEQMKKGCSDGAYGKIRKYFGERKTKGRNIKSSDGKPILEKDQVAERWKKYIESLYKDENSNTVLIEDETEVDDDDKGDAILRSEFDKALKDLSKNKSPGIDQLPAELLSSMGDTGLKRLYNLICKMYNTGEVVSDFKESIVIPIPKKSGADRCENYRTISLTSHASKILTRIIYRRLEKTVEAELDDDQFGFRKNMGTREAILSLRLILEGRIRKGLPTFMAFVDLEKAFDNVNWRKIFEILKKIGVKYRDRRIIWSLYKDQTAVTRVDGHETRAAIQKGVRQGCSLSPLLFNLYIEQAIKEVKEQFEAGVTVHGQNIKMLRFADDIVVLAESEKDLEFILNGMDFVLRQSYKMNINKDKTKVMKCCRSNSQIPMNIKLANENLNEVNEFCYLGSKITNDGKSKEDIKSRLALARRAFVQKRTLFTSNIGLATRKTLLKSYIWSIALYGCETWTVGKQEKKRIDSFEMWCYRRMLKVKWTDHVRNEVVLERIGEEMSLWKILTRRRDRLVGHILRHPGLVNIALEGKIEGKNCRGRPRLDYVRQIINDVGCRNYKEMKELAQVRKAWRAASNRSADC